MKLEAGKTYTRRDGQQTGKLTQVMFSGWLFDPKFSVVYDSRHENGHQVTPGIESEEDLVQ